MVKILKASVCFQVRSEGGVFLELADAVHAGFTSKQCFMLTWNETCSEAADVSFLCCYFRTLSLWQQNSRLKLMCNGCVTESSLSQLSAGIKTQRSEWIYSIWASVFFSACSLSSSDQHGSRVQRGRVSNSQSLTVSFTAESQSTNKACFISIDDAIKNL